MRIDIAALGTFTPHAREVLERAGELAGNKPVTLAHVLLTELAVLPTRRAPADHDSALGRLFDLTKSQDGTVLTTALEERIESYPWQSEPSRDGVTEELRQCIAQLDGGRSKISEPLLMWAVLNKALTGSLQQTLSRVGRRTAIQWEQVLAELRSASGPSGLKAQPHVPVLDYLIAYDPGAPRFRYAKRHHSMMSEIANKLYVSKHNFPSLAVVSGMRGTPVDRVPFILADALATQEYYGQELTLRSIRRVYGVHMGQLLAILISSSMPTSDQQPTAAVALENCFKHAQDDQAMLIIEDLEMLSPDDATAGRSEKMSLIHQIMVCLRRYRDVPVLGIYLKSKSDDSAKNGLAPCRVQEAPIQEYAVAGTLVVLDKYFLPEWKAGRHLARDEQFDDGMSNQTEGYSFAPDAFTIALALREGVAAWHKPTWVLPYSIVTLAYQVLDVARSPNHDLVPQIAERAQRNVDALLQQKGRIKQPIWSFYEEALTDASALVIALQAGGIPPAYHRPEGNHTIHEITSALVTAQLLGTHSNRFEFPSELPRHEKYQRAHPPAGGNDRPPPRRRT